MSAMGIAASLVSDIMISSCGMSTETNIKVTASSETNRSRTFKRNKRFWKKQIRIMHTSTNHWAQGKFFRKILCKIVKFTRYKREAIVLFDK